MFGSLISLIKIGSSITWLLEIHKAIWNVLFINFQKDRLHKMLKKKNWKSAAKFIVQTLAFVKYNLHSVMLKEIGKFYSELPITVATFQKFSSKLDKKFHANVIYKTPILLCILEMSSIIQYIRIFQIIQERSNLFSIYQKLNSILYNALDRTI